MQRGFAPLLPTNLLDLVARAYAVVEVGGLDGCGPQRGRDFEQLFYNLCNRRGVRLCERAGARTVAESRAASGFSHEVDGATRAAACITHWELKHLSVPVPKNELLVFNGKSLDFLLGSRPLAARTPMLRFLLSGASVRDESRYFSVQWGIMIIERFRLPLPLLYEAVARGAADSLTPAERAVVQERVFWACRPLQAVIAELHEWGAGTSAGPRRYGPDALRIAKEVIDAQEQIGATVLDHLDEHHHDWLDDAAEEMWRGVGGW